MSLALDAGAKSSLQGAHHDEAQVHAQEVLNPSILISQPGIYIARLVTPAFSKSIKMGLLK